jgi:hypothetical protein
MKDFMKNYGTLYWTFWFFFLLPVTFGVPEWMAIKWDGLTLSSYTDILTTKFPLLIFGLGILVGVLAAHFWWHWMGPGTSGG